MDENKPNRLWILKHAPAKLGDCAGNEEAREEMRQWALLTEAGKPAKPLLLAGPTGVGKTAAVRALAAEMGWQIIETNASEHRDRESLERLFGGSGSSLTLFGSKRLIVVDEVDAGLDKGGLPAISALVSAATQPVLLVANDAWNPKIASLRAYCKIVEFKPVNATTVRKALDKIAVAEGGRDATLVSEISLSCNGDLRSAVNDLQAGFTGERERKHNVFRVVGKIFKTESYGEALKAADDSEVDFDLLYRWLEENVPAEYEKPGEIAAAYDWLARGDVFRSRIMKRQAWKLYKYVRALVVAGVAVAKEKRYSKFSRYAFPTIMKKLSAARESRAALKSAAKKTGAKMHCEASCARDALSTIGWIEGATTYFGLTETEAGLFAPAGKLAGKKAKNEKNEGKRQKRGNQG